MKTRFVSFALVFIAVCVCPRTVLASSFADGVSHYQAGRYRQAVIDLAKSSAVYPRNPLVHYYLANSLVHVGENEQAAQEYRLCLVLNPTGPVADYCRKALRGYRLPVPDPRELARERAAIIGDSQNLLTDSGGATSAAAQPVSSSLTIIRRQVEHEKQKNKAISDSTAMLSIEQAKKEVQFAQQRMQAEIDKLWGPQTVNNPNLMDRNYLQMREQQIRTAESDEEEMIMRRAQSKAERYKQVSNMKEDALDQVADNLEHQLADSSTVSGVKLIPQGTDLYVRRYLSVRPPKALPEAHAAVARIWGRTEDGASDLLKANAQRLPAVQPADVTQSVQGKLIK